MLDYLHFQNDTFEDYLQQVKRQAAWYVKLAGLPVIRNLIPKSLVKKFVMEPLTKGKDGTMYWINNNLEGRILSFFGTKETWAQIPDWDVDMPDLNIDPIRLNHGYDEGKPKSELDIKDMQDAAGFRGGECHSENMTAGDLTTKLKWRCVFDHEFEASPTLVLLGGHWCPECEPPPWNYDEIAKKNPFFAQVWYPNHDENESNFYDERCFEDIL